MLTIALIAHENKKKDLIQFIIENKEQFIKKKIIATSNTGSLIESCELDVTKMESGTRGGDAQIASLIINKQIDAVIFIIDPLEVHPHQVDVRMLIRICNIYNVPLATNLRTANLLIPALSQYPT